MPERYTIGVKAAQIKERYAVEVPKAYKARYNAAPTQLLPVIANDSPGGLSFFYWGTTPDWSKNKTISTKLINADVESINQKTSLKRALNSRRCIIPADGFYEWKRISKKGRVPHRFVLGNNEIFSIAGIWQEYEDENDTNIHTFMMITTEANSSVSAINDRMPAIIDKNSEQKWLDESTSEDELFGMLTAYPADNMGSYTVAPAVNDPANEGPSLIQVAPPADQFGNYSLFN
ncbi:MAG: SOS response-associated peptidase [Bacteroidota bacterium]